MDIEFPFLHLREATNPPHLDLPAVSPAFMALWQGVLSVPARKTTPYVSFTFLPEAGSIAHIHPNDFLSIIETLATQQSPHLDIIGLYGPTPPRTPLVHKGVKYLFVACACAADAQGLVDRYKGAQINWRQFPIFTRTGYEYDRGATGAYSTQAPLFVDPILVEIGTAPPPGDWGRDSRGRGDDARYQPYGRGNTGGAR